jgi:hypothetical protein
MGTFHKMKAKYMPLDPPPGGGTDQTASAPSTDANPPAPNADATVRKSWVTRWFSRHDSDPNAIRDMRFMNRLTTLTRLQTFLLSEGVHIRAEDAPLFSFGTLYQLRYHDRGRLPTVDEWKFLDDERGKRFQLMEAANLIAGLPILLIVVAFLLAFLSLMIAIITSDSYLLFCWYFLWTMCLGALGSIAYLSVNALSIQTDIPFDLTNKSLLAVRIVLGSLFGLVLSIPFGFDGFVAFSESILRHAAGDGGNTVIRFSLQAVLLLLPFILGLSTSLVILVLNRFVESIAFFFGHHR